MPSTRPAAAVGALAGYAGVALAALAGPLTSVQTRSRQACAPSAKQASARALQGQQPCHFATLPDALPHKVVCAAWDARPARLAGAEVQHALSLERLSKRFQRVLRADPLRLRLDFSDTRLAQRHLDWLAAPSWADRVEALTLYNWPAPAGEERSRNFLDPSLCTDGDVVSPLLAVLRAGQRASLRQLLGMPLRLDGVPIPMRIPDNFDGEDSDSQLPVPLVDLSMFCLKQLGVPSGFGNGFVYGNLPQTLVTLLYRGSYRASSVCRWVPCAAAHAAARLPCLSSVHLSGSTLVVVAPHLLPCRHWLACCH
jgi:hypothetical protein